MATTDPTLLVRAAGCVLWRHSVDSPNIEIALIYRPQWEDWSHPKGKLHHGETHRSAAVREVREETGMGCLLGVPLPTARYCDAQGRPKEVRYWAAEATDGDFMPNREVSRLVWLPPVDARQQITHDRDQELIDALLSALHETGESSDRR